MVMVLVAFSSAKVVLNSTYLRTSTWFPAKPTKHPSYGLNWSGDNCKLAKVFQSITSSELPWSIKALCTFRPTVITNITTGSFSWETTSSRSAPVKHRAGSWARPGLLDSKDITAQPYRLHLVVELPPPENFPEMVFNSCGSMSHVPAPWGQLHLMVLPTCPQDTPLRTHPWLG